MSTNFKLVTGDTGSSVQFTCVDNDTGLPIGLVGATVRLRWKDGATVVTKTMTIIDAANGIVKYTFLAGEIVEPSMKFEVEITDGGGLVISSLTLVELKVRKELG